MRAAQFAQLTLMPWPRLAMMSNAYDAIRCDASQFLVIGSLQTAP